MCVCVVAVVVVDFYLIFCVVAVVVVDFSLIFCVVVFSWLLEIYIRYIRSM